MSRKSDPRPKVSIIIPNYNYAEYLPRRLRSVLEQTYQDFEIIFVDDCSTDKSIEVTKEHLAGHQVEYIVSNRNSGSPFKSWNKGVQQALGKYLWLAEADDWADPRFLSETILLMEKNPQIGIVYCSSKIVDSQDAIIGETIPLTDDLNPRLWRDDFIMNGANFCVDYLSSRNIIHNASAVLIRRSVWEKAGQAEESMRLCGDWLQWCKMLKYSDIAYIARPLNFFRTHSQSARQKVIQDFSDVPERYNVVQFITRNFKISASRETLVLEQLFLDWINRFPQISSLSRIQKLQRLLSIYREIRIFDQSLLSRIIMFSVRHLLKKIMSLPKCFLVEIFGL